MTTKQTFVATLCCYFMLAGTLVLSESFVGRIVDGLRLISGSIGLLFLPGYRITKAWFSESDLLEQIALSFAFSISIIPLLVFYLNVIGLKISSRSVLGSCIACCIVGYVIRHRQQKIAKPVLNNEL